MKVITPSVRVGEESDVVWLSDLQWALDPTVAIAIIQGGKSALIPAENWKGTSPPTASST
jgi:hypothetical protein